MLCKDLRDGMLITLSDDQFCAWINFHSHENLKEAWGEDTPPRLKVGGKVIGSMLSTKVFTSKDTLVYIGKKIVRSLDMTKTRQLRLILAGGQVGILEGYDVKHFEPVQSEVNKR